MTVKELIEKLSSFDTDKQVFIKFMKPSFGAIWEALEDFDEEDVFANCNIVVLDISNK